MRRLAPKHCPRNATEVVQEDQSLEPFVEGILRFQQPLEPLEAIIETAVVRDGDLQRLRRSECTDLNPDRNLGRIGVQRIGNRLEEHLH